MPQELLPRSAELAGNEADRLPRSEGSDGKQPSPSLEKAESLALWRPSKHSDYHLPSMIATTARSFVCISGAVASSFRPFRENPKEVRCIDRKSTRLNSSHL